MDSLWHELESSRQNEDSLYKILEKFLQKNKSNFDLQGSSETKSSICKFIYDHISPLYCDDGSKWSLSTQALSLGVLKIFTRSKERNFICSDDSLKSLVSIAYPATSKQHHGCVEHDQKMNATKSEAVKCLCNILLNHKDLISNAASELGITKGVAERLRGHYQESLPYDLIYYDLRLLFLITACDMHQRSVFREQFNGILIVTNIIERTLFPTAISPPTTSSSGAIPTPQASSGVVTLDRTPPTEEDMNVLCESLKIIFNQTMHWEENQVLDENTLSVMRKLGHLIRVISVSVPPQFNSQTLTLFTHIVEVLVNVPPAAVECLLMSPDIRVMPFLIERFPKIYTKKFLAQKEPIEGGVASGIGVVYSASIDRVFESHNLAAVLSLLNVLHIRLSGQPGGHSIPTLFTALRAISKRNRTVRRFLRAEILPPLGAVTHRPDEGDSLKSKIVRLMTAANPYGAEEVVAEFLFVLCKESASRLVKHTGYGRAAGLLMAHGLLSGGTSPGQSNYSSDENSDTEEYEESQSKIDPMTGGPSTKDGPSPLDGMTDDEKEAEAKKLHGLIQKLNEHGIIKMATKLPTPPSSEEDD